MRRQEDVVAGQIQTIQEVRGVTYGQKWVHVQVLGDIALSFMFLGTKNWYFAGTVTKGQV